MLLCLLMATTARAADLHTGWVAGVSIGPDIPLGRFEMGVVPRLELGLAKLAGPVRVEPFVTGAWTRVSRVGSATDDGVGGDYTYLLQQDVWQIGAGVAVQPGKMAGPIRPEVGAALLACAVSARENGHGPGGDFGETRERYVRPGGLVTVGVAATLGPGELTVEAEIGFTGLAGTMAGDALSARLAPALGYRFIF
jgi:hypothetical protein